MSVLPVCTKINHGQSQKQCKLIEPIEIGHFSIDGEQQFHHDRHQLSYINDQIPKGRLHTRKRLDLNDGYKDRFIPRKQGGGLEGLLRWMLVNKTRFVPSEEKKKENKSSEVQQYPDFQFWTGHLAKLMCTPYERREGWMMACQKLHQTIYIIELANDDDEDEEKQSDCENNSGEIQTEEIKDQREKQRDRMDRICYWGVRFEVYMTLPFQVSREKKTVVDQSSCIINANTSFYSVLQSRLNQHHSFVYGGEVDCCQPVEKLTPPDCYIELKTSRVFTSRKQENFYRFKALKWWAQSYFNGVPEITCGFRDDDGFVRTIDTFSTWELPRIASRLPNSWDPVVCLNFLDVLLTDIKELFRKDKSIGDSVVIICWDPGDEHVRYFKEDDYSILPDWYIEEVTSWQT